MSSGVEWALHCYLVLAWTPGRQPVQVSDLAAAYDLPQAYLTKHLQALVRAGLLRSTPGPRGGYSLQKPPEETSVLEVVQAVEGDGEMFRCADIRLRGPLAPAPCGERGDRAMCLVHKAMWEAERAWRDTLAGQSMAELAAQVAGGVPGLLGRAGDWLAERQRQRS
ncbi:RrF2 family transcriptional regulator [Amycolatopsis silviterrae]|uniref:RrF2 family transcriptional regulator n=1 Tax=Amycolatopsis silviterrae TaxID=1656914 RepID=A0ABW5H2W5_9PSEU